MKTAYAFVGLSVLMYILATMTAMTASVSVALAAHHPNSRLVIHSHSSVHKQVAKVAVEKQKVVRRAAWRGRH